MNTGAGHIAPARALSKALEEKYSKTSVPVLLDGFNEKMKLSRFFFEKGYLISTNYFEPSYVLFYRLTEISFCIRLGDHFVSIQGENNLVRFMREQEITKIVCLHEVLILMARRAINRVNPSIPLITLVTDPFTAHALWFYEKKMEMVVFSEKLRAEAISKYGYQAEHVHCFPFILSKTYEHRYSADEVLAARKRHGIPDGKKVLLIAGGGEGLKSADRLVSGFIKRKRPEILIVVCGKNRLLKRLVSLMVEQAGATNIHVYGFVPFMPDLLNIADCVITKGGASTVMEVLSVAKPVIFSTFIRGQELGNVLYVVHNGAGWYIKKTNAILDQAQKVLEDPEISKRVTRNVARLNIRNGLDEVITFIHDFPSA